MITVIRTKPAPQEPKKRYQPKPIWWKNMSKAQQESYILALDHLDKGAMKRK